jgi:hypothetical protein
MNVRSEPKVRPTLDLGEPARSLKRKVKRGYEIPKAGGQFWISGVGRVETLHHQESWNCEMRNTEIPKAGGQFQIPGVGRIETLHHQESRNREMRNPENPKQAHQSKVWIPGVGGVKSRDSSSQESRSREMRNVETPFCVDFGYREMECQNTSSQGMPEC